ANVGRYWRQLRVERADLQAAFPQADSFDQDRFIEWADNAWRFEDRSALVRATSRLTDALIPTVATNAGLNVVGYATYDVSLGGIVREVAEALSAAHVPHALIDHRRTSSPRSAHPPATTREVAYATTIAVVNADQFEFLVADYGPQLLDGR